MEPQIPQTIRLGCKFLLAKSLIDESVQVSILVPVNSSWQTGYGNIGAGGEAAGRKFLFSKSLLGTRESAEYCADAIGGKFLLAKGLVKHPRGQPGEILDLLIPLCAFRPWLPAKGAKVLKMRMRHSSKPLAPRRKLQPLLDLDSSLSQT
jgi:hypothetical protein